MRNNLADILSRQRKIKKFYANVKERAVNRNKKIRCNYEKFPVKYYKLLSLYLMHLNLYR